MLTLNTLSVSDNRLSTLRNTDLHHFEKVGVKANFPHEDVLWVVYRLCNDTDNTIGIYLMKPSTLGVPLLSY